MVTDCSIKQLTDRRGGGEGGTRPLGCTADSHNTRLLPRKQVALQLLWETGQDVSRLRPHWPSLVVVFFFCCRCCVSFSWDNGDTEKMSPWDMEPIPDDGRSHGWRTQHKHLNCCWWWLLNVVHFKSTFFLHQSCSVVSQLVESQDTHFSIFFPIYSTAPWFFST